MAPGPGWADVGEGIETEFHINVILVLGFAARGSERPALPPEGRAVNSACRFGLERRLPPATAQNFMAGIPFWRLKLSVFTRM